MADGSGQFILPLASKMIVDLFAGGGGMSTALEQVFGRHADLAVNHSETALSMHQMNHPQTKHLIADVFEVDPREATQGRVVGHLHLSPDCTHFSQARGGQPRSGKIRALAWVGVRWCGQVKPEQVSLENVKQMQLWGPLIAKRDPATGRVVTLEQVISPETGKLANRVADPGERVPRQNQFLVPDPKRVGETWKRYLSIYKKMGYDFKVGLLTSSDFGAATSRERLFLYARCDGQNVEWPEPMFSRKPTAGKKKSPAAASIIDWSIPTQSIFNRKRDLVPATLRRVAVGTKRYVLDAADPFIVDKGIITLAPHLQQMTQGGSEHSIDKPLVTITTAKGGELALVTASMVTLRGTNIGSAVTDPLRTASAGGEHHALVEYKLSEDHEEGALRVAAFLMRYYGTGGQWGDLRDPAPTVTTKDRLALVTVVVKGTPMLIVDIGLRMLTPRELYLAMGFPASYVIDRGHDGRVFTKAQQVRMVGNSVSPPPAIALLRANHFPMSLQKAA